MNQTKPVSEKTSPDWVSHCPQCLQQSPLRQTSEPTLAKSGSSFVAAILVWLNKPHVVNRRLIGSRLITTLSHHPRITSKAEIRAFIDTVKDRFAHDNRQTSGFSLQESVEKEQNCIDFTTEGAVESGHHRKKEGCLMSGDSGYLTNEGCVRSDRSEDLANEGSITSNRIEDHTKEGSINDQAGRHMDEDSVMSDVTHEQDGHFENEESGVGGLYTDIQIENLVTSSPEDLVVFARDLLPKNLGLNQILRELVIYDQLRQEFHFCPIARFDREGTYLSVDNDVPYSFRYLTSDSGSRIELKICGSLKEEPSLASMTYLWLEKRLLCKIARWSKTQNLRTNSLTLRTVSLEAYNQLYNQLKAKYGPKLIEEWPERTDPEKFVYEDIAIATFLLLLWEKERQETQCRNQTFVDLGCGNGLLVHLLTSEGHSGIGIDIHKRKIWDLYGDGTRLELRTLTPSADSLFPEHDWIIGNHSDELTPWIPVIAARSSYNCRFFVLPCCLFDFDGKYNKTSPNSSNYHTYLNYIKTIITVCGFQVEEDVLRIPSTKQNCFYGKTRTYCQSEEIIVDQRRTEFIENHCSKEVLPNKDQVSSNTISSDLTKMKDAKNWSDNFKPRPAPKKSGLFNSVSWDIKKGVVDIVVEKILADDDSFISLPDGRVWHKGGEIPLSEVAQLLDQDTLNSLKAINGGLQTLLRKFSHIFKVISKRVELRDYTQPWQQRRKVKRKNTTKLYKSSLCWFYQNHPDGCPVSKEGCNFAHGEEELREKTLQ